MKYIYLLALLLLHATWCLGQDTITVTGKTENRKNGAVVISSETGLAYFVGGLSHWEENVVDKTVKVSGVLRVWETKPRRRKKVERQEAIGIHRTILKPQWELVEPVKK